MKISSIITPMLVAATAYAASGAHKVTQAEYNDWEGCLQNLLKAFDEGEVGDRAPCDYWSCLHVAASKHDRGGILTGASNVLTGVCGVDNVASHLLGWVHEPQL
ncbi:uncharacterized protein P174DRAFT_430307 [Aspergillus novofumigatus IBT 16806]|uniref:Uncharacterized protein n=1 Tax=Aspergillus novofumigatus (strain IBT 16806) TaxID=1392255 RepID=A0A2I1CEF6_ASPN1|nr:uncharacterized protein P174DRAFT_430307 [Aspergillus novofumigatus IBT 16806]PKX96005.1 hypothetical protein P174DRAFT_430307 [Aspergillus novofumigatus IBT 16806]